MDSSTSSSGLRVALLFVGGSSDLERAVVSLSLLVFSLLVLVGHGGNLGPKAQDTQCFSELDSIGGGLVSVEQFQHPLAAGEKARQPGREV